MRSETDELKDQLEEARDSDRESMQMYRRARDRAERYKDLLKRILKLVDTTIDECDNLRPDHFDDEELIRRVFKKDLRFITANTYEELVDLLHEVVDKNPELLEE